MKAIQITSNAKHEIANRFIVTMDQFTQRDAVRQVMVDCGDIDETDSPEQIERQTDDCLNGGWTVFESEAHDVICVYVDENDVFTFIKI